MTPSRLPLSLLIVIEMRKMVHIFKWKDRCMECVFFFGPSIRGNPSPLIHFTVKHKIALFNVNWYALSTSTFSTWIGVRSGDVTLEQCLTWFSYCHLPMVVKMFSADVFWSMFCCCDDSWMRLLLYEAPNENLAKIKFNGNLLQIFTLFCPAIWLPYV